jgi:hypothetical protein
MPDFGIMRGFNEKLFGDKLVAGQLPTQLGLIGSQGVFDIDADAQAFFDRVTAAGGTLSATEKTAVDTLVKQMKLDGTWTPMKAIYPMVGASAAACAQNLKSSSFTGTFTSGWTFASTGAKPNGTSAYMETGFEPSANLTANNASIGYYGGTTGVTTGAVLGSANFSGSGSYFEIFPAYPGYGLFGDVFDGSVTFTANSNAAGFIFAYRNSSSTEKKHSIRGTITTKTESTRVLDITSTVVLAARKNISSIQEYTNNEHRFSFIGEGLTDTQASNFYTAVQAFQTTLSRNV